MCRQLRFSVVTRGRRFSVARTVFDYYSIGVVVSVRRLSSYSVTCAVWCILVLLLWVWVVVTSFSMFRLQFVFSTARTKKHEPVSISVVSGLVFVWFITSALAMLTTTCVRRSFISGRLTVVAVISLG